VVPEQSLLVLHALLPGAAVGAVVGVAVVALTRLSLAVGVSVGPAVGAVVGVAVVALTRLSLAVGVSVGPAVGAAVGAVVGVVVGAVVGVGDVALTRLSLARRSCRSARPLSATASSMCSSLGSSWLSGRSVTAGSANSRWDSASRV